MGKNKILTILIAVLAVILAGLMVAAVLLGRDAAEQPETSAPENLEQTAGTREPAKTETTAPAESGETIPQNTEQPGTEPAQTEPKETEPKATEPGKTDPTKPGETTKPVETTQPEETTPPTQKEYSTLAQAYIDYTGMSGDAQMKFYYSFASGEAFTEWYKSAKAAYDAETEEIYIGADGQVNAGKD